MKSFNNHSGLRGLPCLAEGIYWATGLSLPTPFTEGRLGVNNKASPPGRHQEPAPKQRCTFSPTTFSSDRNRFYFTTVHRAVLCLKDFMRTHRSIEGAIFTFVLRAFWICLLVGVWEEIGSCLNLRSVFAQPPDICSRVPAGRAQGTMAQPLGSSYSTAGPSLTPPQIFFLGLGGPFFKPLSN